MKKVALIDIISFLFSLLINSSLWLVINCVSLSHNSGLPFSTEDLIVIVMFLRFSNTNGRPYTDCNVYFY